MSQFDYKSFSSKDPGHHCYGDKKTPDGNFQLEYPAMLLGLSTLKHDLGRSCFQIGKNFRHFPRCNMIWMTEMNWIALAMNGWNDQNDLPCWTSTL